MYSKDSLRNEITRRLSLMSPQQREKSSRNLCRTILDSPEYKEADALFAYYPFGKETNIIPLLGEALMNEKAVLLPRITGYDMDFHSLSSLDREQLIPNRWKIYEPDPCLPIRTGQDFAKPLMLMPGVAFTKGGKRLGRGGGYYDRYLERERGNLILAGTAYPCQMVEELPTEAHDILLDRVFY